MDDDFGEDADFSAAVAAVEKSHQRQPAASAAPPIVQQPTPQALPSRSAPSAILVSPRQKGNPILTSIRSLPWEYSDIPSDFVLGLTTCALFLSLKYHRLHPEYIYSRIRALGGKYNLRILLTMVDIQNHEESLRELSKTSLINNLTLILTWSASEAGRYLELFKTYEHASPTSIRAHQATSYSEKLIEFITVPRSINKTDAVGLVSAFGSVRAAVNALPEEISGITGWGEKKVERWCGTMREPFRVRKAARRGLEGDSRRAESSINLPRNESSMIPTRDESFMTDDAGQTPLGGRHEDANREREKRDNTADRRPDHRTTLTALSAEKGPLKRPAENAPPWEPGPEEEEALLLAAAEAEDLSSTSGNVASGNEGLSEGMMAALAKLRKE